MGGRIALLLVITLFVSQTTLAANVGVSPANAEFPQVLRGGYAERPIRITLDTEESIPITATTWGDIADWINVSAGNFTVSRSDPYTLIASIQPPIDTPNGEYEGFIRIESATTGRGRAGRATGLIIPVLDVHVKVKVTDQEVRGCRASNFDVASVEEGDDLSVTLNVLNTGNVWFSPRIDLTIWDQDAATVVREVRHSDTSVVPTKDQKVVISFSSDDLGVGQYWVDVAAVDCYSEQTLTFDVLEEGALRASGVLNRITVPTWADEGDTIPILVSFTNTGEKPVRSKFKGQVLLQNKIVQLFESDEDVTVDIGEDGQYQFFFTPKSAGRYLVSGRVFYDGKRTYERSAALNVRPKNSFLNTTMKMVSYIALIAIIALLLAKIRKERRSYTRRVRRIR